MSVTGMRIGFVSSSATAGGAEAHTIALGDGLRRRGHEVTLYGQCPGWREHDLPQRDIHLGPKWSRKTLPAAMLRIPRERQRVRALPDASLYYLQFKREQVSLTGSLSRKAPVVWTEHGRWMGGQVGRLLLKAYAHASRQVSAIVCVSEEVARDLSAVIEPEKLVVISNAVDTQRFAPASPEARREARQRLLPQDLWHRSVAVMASRLHGAKRHERAIAAARASNSALVVVGDGPDRSRLEDLAAGLDVFFAGHQEDVAGYLAAGDYYLYCGAETDGTPTGVLEAASAGLAVVAFSGDPGVGLVGSVGGVVVDDPAELSESTVEYLKGLYGKGVSYVEEHHSRERWLDSYERVLKGCAK